MRVTTATPSRLIFMTTAQESQGEDDVESLPPESSKKKAALHALWPTFGGLLLIGAAGCRFYGVLFEGRYWFS